MTEDQFIQRLTAIEEAVARIEHMVETLDGVVRTVNDRMDAQSRRFERLQAVIDHVRSATAEPRTLEDDKPPHY